jgi:hypothetical protein
MHQFGALLAALHVNDLLREAEAERRRRLVDGSRPSTRPGSWSGFRSPLARLVASLRPPRASRTDGTRAATA